MIREQKKAKHEAKMKHIEVEQAIHNGGKCKQSRCEVTPPSSPSASENEVDDDSDDDADVICTEPVLLLYQKIQR